MINNKINSFYTTFNNFWSEPTKIIVPYSNFFNLHIVMKWVHVFLYIHKIYTVNNKN